MQMVTGRIIVIQEERFRLVTDRGRGLLLTLSHQADVTVADLRRWQETGQRVTVYYRGEPNLTSGAAYSLHEAEPAVA